MSNEKTVSYLSHYRIYRIGMESSNQVAPLHRELARKGYTLSVSHPRKTRYIAKARVKSARIDSEATAELARLDELPLAYMPN